MSQKRAIVSLTTAKEFSNFISQHKYVVVKVTADWCGPCQRIKPLCINQIQQLPIEVAIVIVDISKPNSLKNYLKIGSVPYMMSVINGDRTDIINTSEPTAIINFFAKTARRVTEQ